MGKQLKYIISIILSVATLMGAIGLGAFAVLFLFDGNVTGTIICAGAAVICLVIYKIMFNVRTQAREDADFDQYGNKKGVAYKNLSAKDRRAIDLQRLADSERILSTGELKKITFKGSKDPEGELNNLIGLETVKEDVLRIKAKIEYGKKYKKKTTNNSNGLHMCFSGSPGTGKTTVARIMAGILYKYRCIKENKYIEVDAAFLKGSTPDETVRRTQAILSKARGGVLFIDEAYSLLNGVNAAEIVACLVKYMEDNKKDFVLILAGYQNDMKKLIDSNPGLASRISKYLYFKDYNIEELKTIFTALANEAGYCVDEGAYERFEMEIMKEKAKKNFGNARSVRNLFQKCLDNHAYNVMTNAIGEDKVYVITGIDVVGNTNGPRFT